MKKITKEILVLLCLIVTACSLAACMKTKTHKVIVGISIEGINAIEVDSNIDNLQVTILYSDNTTDKNLTVKDITITGLDLTKDGLYEATLAYQNFEEKINIEVKRYFNITYTSGNNGKVEGNLNQRVLKGQSGEKVTAIPDEGYRFKEWSDKTTGITHTQIKANGDKVIQAIFEPITYRITYYNYNFNSLVYTPSAELSGIVGLNEIVTIADYGNSGYDFLGYVTSVKNAGIRNDLDATYVTEYPVGKQFSLTNNLDLYPVFKSKVHNINIVDYNDVLLSVIPTISGTTSNLYELSGSILQQYITEEMKLYHNYRVEINNTEITNSENFVKYPITSDIVIRVRRTAIKKSISFSFCDQTTGETIELSQSVAYGSNVAVLDIFKSLTENHQIIKEGYYGNLYYGDTVIEDNYLYNVTQDRHYEYRLTANEYSVTVYDIPVFDTDSSKFVIKEKRVYGETLGYSENELKGKLLSDSNYIFSGFYTDYECTIPYDFNTLITNNLVLYAGYYLELSFTASTKFAEIRLYNTDYEFAKGVSVNGLSVYVKYNSKSYHNGIDEYFDVYMLENNQYVKYCALVKIFANNYDFAGYFTDSTCAISLDLSQGFIKKQDLYLLFELAKYLLVTNITDGSITYSCTRPLHAGEKIMLSGNDKVYLTTCTDPTCNPFTISSSDGYNEVKVRRNAFIKVTYELENGKVFDSIRVKDKEISYTTSSASNGNTIYTLASIMISDDYITGNNIILTCGTDYISLLLEVKNNGNEMLVEYGNGQTISRNLNAGFYGNVSLKYGDSVKMSFNATAGNLLTGIKVNDVIYTTEQLAYNETTRCYEFVVDNITQDFKVEVYTHEKEYKVVVNESNNGNVSIVKEDYKTKASETFKYNASNYFTITPIQDYELAILIVQSVEIILGYDYSSQKFTVNNVECQFDTLYNLDNITIMIGSDGVTYLAVNNCISDLTVQTTFIQQKISIKVNTVNGMINHIRINGTRVGTDLTEYDSLVNGVDISYGDQLAISATPYNGYYLKTISVNGEFVDSIPTVITNSMIIRLYYELAIYNVELEVIGSDYGDADMQDINGNSLGIFYTYEYGNSAYSIIRIKAIADTANGYEANVKIHVDGVLKSIEFINGYGEIAISNEHILISVRFELKKYNVTINLIDHYKQAYVEFMRVMSTGITPVDGVYIIKGAQPYLTSEKIIVNVSRGSYVSKVTVTQSGVVTQYTNTNDIATALENQLFLRRITQDVTISIEIKYNEYSVTDVKYDSNSVNNLTVQYRDENGNFVDWDSSKKYNHNTLFRVRFAIDNNYQAKSVKLNSILYNVVKDGEYYYSDVQILDNSVIEIITDLKDINITINNVLPEIDGVRTNVASYTVTNVNTNSIISADRISDDSFSLKCTHSIELQFTYTNSNYVAVVSVNGDVLTKTNGEYIISDILSNIAIIIRYELKKCNVEVTTTGKTEDDTIKVSNQTITEDGVQNIEITYNNDLIINVNTTRNITIKVSVLDDLGQVETTQTLYEGTGQHRIFYEKVINAIRLEIHYS